MTLVDRHPLMSSRTSALCTPMAAIPHKLAHMTDGAPRPANGAPTRFGGNIRSHDSRS
jgi:hypothetical protein